MLFSEDSWRLHQPRMNVQNISACKLSIPHCFMPRQLCVFPTGQFHLPLPLSIEMCHIRISSICVQQSQAMTVLAYITWLAFVDSVIHASTFNFPYDFLLLICGCCFILVYSCDICMQK